MGRGDRIAKYHLFRDAAPDDGTLDVLKSGEDTVRATLGSGAEFRL